MCLSVRTPPLAKKSAKIGNAGHEWTLNNFGQRAMGNGQRAHGQCQSRVDRKLYGLLTLPMRAAGPGAGRDSDRLNK
jgi:hypothetical protein